SDTSPSQLSPSNYDVCAIRVEPIPQSTTMTFRCESTDIFGRYVFVRRKGSNIVFQLCEVEVYAYIALPAVPTANKDAPGNVALGRPTFQSSVRGGRGASLAVDGNRNPDADNVGSCSVMDVATRAWWTVDLGAIVNVKEVAISQRNQFAHKLSNFIVAATNVTPSDTSPSQLSPSDYDVCATRVDPIPQSTTMTFRCESTDVFGRYVFVLKQGPNTNFHLCEVEVYVYKPPVNIALGRLTFQSSVRYGRGASLAVDGNRNPDADNVGSCSATEARSQSWWAVDLEAVVNVKEVAISQRNTDVNNLANFIVGVTDMCPSITSPRDLSTRDYDVCATRVDPIPQSTTMTFRCESTDVFGRYVFVLRQDSVYLIMCEVEVYGEYTVQIWYHGYGVDEFGYHWSVLDYTKYPEVTLGLGLRHPF
ncbi:hypothetical protein LSAT2_004921, partial [Lamellibrachia satsuma]